MTLLALLLAGSLAAPTRHLSEQSSDSARLVGVVAGFHAALRAGDSATALRLLDRGAVILETGEAESRADYRAHHLREDIAFARTVQSKDSVLLVSVSGSVGWVASTSVTEGTFAGRRVSSSGAELMVLKRTGAGWKIVAIHWSSTARKGGPANRK
jgi:ketosteroid isomerase-like protein